MEVILEFLQSGVLPTVLLILRAIVPLLALYVVWRCYTSFKKGQRRRDPVVMLWDEASGTRFPVLYWENSIGRSKSCDIYLPDEAWMFVPENYLGRFWTLQEPTLFVEQRADIIKFFIYSAPGIGLPSLLGIQQMVFTPRAPA